MNKSKSQMKRENVTAGRPTDYGLHNDDLPRCSKEIAHPQAVWFEEHWRPRFKELKAYCEDLEAELAEEAKINGKGTQRELKLKAERDTLKQALESLKRQIEFLFDNWNTSNDVMITKGFEVSRSALMVILDALGETDKERGE